MYSLVRLFHNNEYFSLYFSVLFSSLPFLNCFAPFLYRFCFVCSFSLSLPLSLPVFQYHHLAEPSYTFRMCSLGSHYYYTFFFLLRFFCVVKMIAIAMREHMNLVYKTTYVHRSYNSFFHFLFRWFFSFDSSYFRAANNSRKNSFNGF